MLAEIGIHGELRILRLLNKHKKIASDRSSRVCVKGRVTRWPESTLLESDSKWGSTRSVLLFCCFFPNQKKKPHSFVYSSKHINKQPKTHNNHHHLEASPKSHNIAKLLSTTPRAQMAQPRLCMSENREEFLVVKLKLMFVNTLRISYSFLSLH